MTEGAGLRDRLLRAAEDEIAEHGPVRASLRGIARRCGVSHQAVAHHFTDRAGLLTALAVEGFARLEQRALDAVAGVGPDAGRQLAAAGTAYVEFASDQRSLFDLMFSGLLHADDPDLVAARQRHRDFMVRTVAAAREAGWGMDVPAEELAAIGWAAVHGLVLLERDRVISAVYPEVDLDEIFLRFVRALSPAARPVGSPGA